MPFTAFGDISPRVAAYAAMDFLRHVEPVLVLGKFGQTKPMPRNKSQVLKFRRLVPYPAVTVPLQEGVTPSVSATTVEDVSVTIYQWGDVHGITDVVADTHEDPILKEMIAESGNQAARTVEQVLYGVLKGGTSVYYNNGANRAAVNTAITLNRIRAVVRYLKNQKAKKINSMLSASTNIGTVPVESTFVAFCHTDVEADLRNVTGFVPVAKYGTMKPLCPEEIGVIEEVRFITSADLASIPDAGGAHNGMITTTGVSADIYPVIFTGRDAYGQVPLKNAMEGGKMGGNNPVTPIVLNPGTPSKSDPLGQRGYVGWKTWFNAVRLNETWMARLEVGATLI